MRWEFTVFLEGVIEEVIHRFSRSSYLYDFVDEIGRTYIFVTYGRRERIGLVFEPDRKSVV